MARQVSEQRIYGNFLQKKSTGLFGLSTAMTFVGMGVMVLTFIALFVSQSIYATLVVLIPGIAAMALSMYKKDNVPLIIYLGDIVKFWGLSRQKKTAYRSGFTSRVPGGTYRCPGLATELELYSVVTIDGTEKAMIYSPSQRSLTMVFKVSPKGSEALSQTMIDTMAGMWGTFLRDLSQYGDCVMASWVTETFPDTGARVVEELQRSLEPTSAELARSLILDVGHSLPMDQVTSRHRVSITFGIEGKTPEDGCHEISQRIQGLKASLDAAGLSPVLMGEDEIIEFTRRAYSPPDTSTLESLAASGEQHDLTFDQAGPVACEEKPHYWYHDRRKSVSFSCYSYPKDGVTEQILRPLLDVNYHLPHKRVCLLYYPVPMSKASTEIDKQARDALHSSGQLKRGLERTDEVRRRAGVEQSRMEISRGHGLCQLGIIVTVTEPEDSDVSVIRQFMNDMGRQCSLLLRPMICHHAAGFAATLGLGIRLETQPPSLLNTPLS